MSAIKEALLAVPRVAVLIPRLAGDERVPLRTKLALTGLGLYIASPWDLIPDFIPVFGQLDDATAILLFVDGVLNQVEDDILVEHWSGDLATLRRLQKLSRMVCNWVPDRLKTFIFGRAVAAGEKHLREVSSVER